jgi:glycosyltransferase involved in cell wall biosynthesis
MSSEHRSTNRDVTVVVTCFNYGAYLPEAVKSALEQEGGAPQVTVVDDGSTEPQTRRALDRLPAGVNLIRQANQGPSSARNAGFRAANTAYLITLDADDRLMPNALSVLREPLDRDPRVGFSYGMARFFGAWEGTLRFPPYDPYRLLYRHIVGASALMRCELFDEVGGFDPDFAAYEDWEFWVHAMAHGWRGQDVEAVTLLYRRHGPTRHEGARAQYRTWFARLRAKHHELYDRAGRRRLAAESDLGRMERAIYRWWWGARPVPARLEVALHAWLWRPDRQGRAGGAPPQREQSA